MTTKGLSHLTRPNKSQIEEKRTHLPDKNANETTKVEILRISSFLWTFSTAVFEARRILIRLTPRRTTLLA